MKNQVNQNTNSNSIPAAFPIGDMWWKPTVIPRHMSINNQLTSGM